MYVELQIRLIFLLFNNSNFFSSDDIQSNGTCTHTSQDGKAEKHATINRRVYSPKFIVHKTVSFYHMNLVLTQFVGRQKENGMPINFCFITTEEKVQTTFLKTSKASFT